MGQALYAPFSSPQIPRPAVPLWKAAVTPASVAFRQSLDHRRGVFQENHRQRADHKTVVRHVQIQRHLTPPDHRSRIISLTRRSKSNRSSRLTELVAIPVKRNVAFACVPKAKGLLISRSWPYRTCEPPAQQLELLGGVVGSNCRYWVTSKTRHSRHFCVCLSVLSFELFGDAIND